MRSYTEIKIHGVFVLRSARSGDCNIWVWISNPSTKSEVMYFCTCLFFFFSSATVACADNMLGSKAKIRLRHGKNRKILMEVGESA